MPTISGTTRRSSIRPCRRFDYDRRTFDPALSIQENCWHSEGSGQADFGFFLDGHYHSIIVLTRWPRMTYPGIIHRLTNLRLLDYTITVNVDPLPITEGNPQGGEGARPRSPATTPARRKSRCSR